MHSVAVEVEVDLPEGVTIRGYERHQGAHVFEVDFDLPARCTCPKCQHEAETQFRPKNDVLVIRDLDLFGQPCFWTYQPPMHICPNCRQRTQIPTPFKRPRVTYTHRNDGSAWRAVPRGAALRAGEGDGRLRHARRGRGRRPGRDERRAVAQGALGAGR